MIKGLIGRKLGMTQLFDEEKGTATPVTVLEVGPCPVIQVKTKENDGYEAVQVGFGAMKKKSATRPQLVRFEKLNLDPSRILREFGPKEPGKLPQPSEMIDVSIFEGVTKVNVVGTSKGKGFQGVQKRWGFRGGPATHGSTFHRRPGAIGMRMTPGEVAKGKKMPGHMGSERVTQKGLSVERIDVERNLLYVKGSVPGPRSGVILIYPDQD
jgi:large subunit ribosomal protein L3